MHTYKAQHVRALFTGSLRLNEGKALSKVTELKCKAKGGNVITLSQERKSNQMIPLVVVCSRNPWKVREGRGTARDTVMGRVMVLEISSYKDMKINEVCFHCQITLGFHEDSDTSIPHFKSIK